MVLGIDASNIRSGGGLTHLVEILGNAAPSDHGIERVVVWASQKTLSALPDRNWLVKSTHPMLNKSFILSFLFQFMLISKLAKKEKTDLMFVPGGTFLGSFPNIVSMSQNMLPFESAERNRFTKLIARLKFLLLRETQSFTFKRSKGVIFLTCYAQMFINKVLHLQNRQEVISHGVNLNFMQQPKVQRDIKEYSMAEPFRLLYVSIVTVYKHQWTVAEAVLRLRNEGWAVSLELVGGSTPESLEKLNAVLGRDRYGCISYSGLVPYAHLEDIYKSADGFIFASSCENQPIILIEAMTAGLPVACSDMGPMPEVLKEAGFYFNPLDEDSVYSTLKDFLIEKEKRQQNAWLAFNRSVHYTWKECSHLTFRYLSQFNQ